MSAATDALAEGLDDALSQHGQEFTVDGEEDSITGIIEDSTNQLAAGMGGMEAVPEITVTIKRAAWTPTHNAIISFQGEDFTVDRINGRIPHKWTFTATSRQQA